MRGPLVDEVHQQFSPWIYQVVVLAVDLNVKAKLAALLDHEIDNYFF